ncbi:MULTISPECIES: DUF4244 domain-containing protein [Saccharothrix]|uniref:DUF4244 domain-containing protein n=1 Tax=Saccharothrix TaxID=2071 RepID=UPI001F526668|nr:DUF4244 domain-containing protein [Saccharothrix sp. CB00851]
MTGKRILLDDGGMSTVEYAIGSLAAAALALLLFSLMSGDWVEGLLRALIVRAFAVDT